MKELGRFSFKWACSIPHREEKKNLPLDIQKNKTLRASQKVYNSREKAVVLERIR